jgi:hypothetical protein
MPDTTTKTTIEVEASPGVQHDFYKDATSALQSGSWAVLLTVGFLYLNFHKQLGKYLEAHINMMVALKDATTINAESVKKMAESEARVACSLESMRVQDEATVNSLEEIKTDLRMVKAEATETRSLVEKLADKFKKRWGIF